MVSCSSERWNTAGVQQAFIDKMLDDGWTFVFLAMSASSLAEFDATTPDPLGLQEPTLTVLQPAALRLAWNRCQVPRLVSAQALRHPVQVLVTVN